MRERHAFSPHRVYAAGLAAALACGAAQAAPPVYVDQQTKFSTAATQPLRDIGLVRGKVQPSLQKAHSDPYGMKDMEGCDALRDEIGALDAALGPDVDNPQPKKGLARTMIRGLAVDAVGGLVKIPFRGVVRHLSGANARDRDRQEATVAGIAL